MTEKKLIQTPLKNIKFATGECIRPSIGQLLTNYAVNDLNESLAKVVEDHMLACRVCREQFVKMGKVFGKKRYSDYSKSDECKKETGEQKTVERFKIAGKKH